VAETVSNLPKNSLGNLNPQEVKVLKELIKRTLLDKGSLALVRSEPFRSVAHKLSQMVSA